MKTKLSISHLTLIIILTLAVMLGVTAAYASVVGSFKIKENRIFFNVVTDSDSNDNLEEFTLPSVIGRTGHVYIYKFTQTFGGGTNINIAPSPEESIDMGAGGNTIFLDTSHTSVTLVGDEANNTWWVVSEID